MEDRCAPFYLTRADGFRPTFRYQILKTWSQLLLYKLSFITTSLSLYIYICIYTCIYVHTCIYMCIYIYIYV